MSITPPKPRDDLATAAAHLSRAAPNSWVNFIEAFDAYTALRVSACVQAPADKVLVTQGKAQQCAELSSLFTNAIQTANAMAKQK